MTREQVKEAADKSWGQDVLPLNQHGYQIGDAVEYLPHVCHAFNANLKNEYPWVFGLKQNPHYEADPMTGEQKIVEDVVELDEGRLQRSVLPMLRNSPDPKEGMKRLVPLRPKAPWPAVVTETHSDGTVDLDVKSNVGDGMVTLHYRNVPIDKSARTPHTCRRKEEV